MKIACGTYLLRMQILLRYFFFVSQTLHICGKVVLLRGSPYTQNGKSSLRDLICLSEDDGGALVWNDIFTPNSVYKNKQFHNINMFIDNEINCKMNKDTDCLKSWSRLNWTLTNSVETPMGPVFDQRWEKFTEYSNFGKSFDHVKLKGQISSKGALSFSTRAPDNVHILFCNTQTFDESSCFWVIIGGWENTESAIRRCTRGVSNISPKKPPPYKDCEILQDSLYHIPLSETEWRTFVITWNFTKNSHNITAFDTDKKIVTYEENKYTRKFKHSSFNFIFIKTRSHMLLRFHEYDFLYTSTESATLTSPTFHLLNSTLCIQMIIGLCTECDAHVVILDSSNFEVIKNVTVKGSLTAVHNLPMWHFITLNKTLSTDNYREVKIQVIPKLQAHSYNPLWAIADVRECSKRESLRQGTIFTTGISSFAWMLTYSNSYYWPNVTCQKLFYNEHTVVSSVPEATTNIDLDDKDCPIGKIGPKCLFSCAHDLKSYDNCKETAICYTNGCTCSPGFQDTECSSLCKNYLYGHNCKNKCGSCKNFNCDKITGECINGCVNTSNKIYIPPLCQIGIDKLEAPSIVSTATSIQAKLRTNWTQEYKDLSLLYSFTLGESDPITQIFNYSIILPWNKLFPNMTHMTGYFKDLKPASFYWVKCILSVEGSLIESEWQNVETACDLATKFVVTPAENSITINVQNNSDPFYPCPPNWYSLQLQYTNSRLIFTEQMTKFSRELSGLNPYTWYDVIIHHAKYNNNSLLYFETVCTLEGVPTEVLDFFYLKKSNTSVNLTWRSPDQPNGKILQYEVTLKINEYCGCTNENLTMPDNPISIKKFTNETCITILDLHPYTSYKAQVRARNSRHSSNDTEIMFSTDKNDIPTEIFSQVEFHNWILSWQSPKDCSTISGSLIAKIKINGVTHYVQNYTAIKQTQFKYINLRTFNPPLNGAERYKATVYVIREFNSIENSSAFQELVFNSPPTAPPVVTNLEVVEIDNRVSSNMTLYLKWHSPLPPLNGQLQYYNVTLCHTTKNCSSKIVELTHFCDLWNDYICEEFPISTINIAIQVIAYNTNVTTASPPAHVSRKMLENTQPSVPDEFTYKINDNSVVDLNWRHPWKTGRHLRCFRITVEEKTTNLKKKRNLRSIDTIKSQEKPVEQYTPYYNERLRLCPSTKYRISIQAETITYETSSSNVIELQTPSDASFDGDLQILKENLNSSIMLHIPPVLNDTCNSVMHIIVKGFKRCKEYSEVPKNLQEQANVKMYEIAWHAAIISTDEIASKNYTFLLGDDLSYGGAKNCPLHPNQFYNVVVIVKEQNSNLEDSFKSLMLTKSINIGEVPSVHYKMWLILIILLLFIVAAGYYIYQRKNKKLKKQVFLNDEIVLSENIEIHEYKSKSVISSSKQDITSTFDKLSIPFDKLSTKSLSRATTPEEVYIDVETIDREKTLSVKVKEFEDYVREAIQSGLLEKQYETFPRGQTRPWTYGKLPQNKSKNRYGNLIAYDETRVILNKLPDDEYSDYINANYITGYKKPKHYIATQGPRPNTVIDFWRMIWQENVLIICMVANVIENGKTKCEQYWPDIGKKKKYGDVIVLNSKHSVFADYCFRTFQVTCGEETRKIEHLHYTAWPDHGVPLYTHSVVTYLKKLLATPPGNGPVVVHCSAGVGRTGTIILCDICLHRAAAEGVIIPSCCLK